MEHGSFSEESRRAYHSPRERQPLRGRFSTRTTPRARPPGRMRRPLVGGSPEGRDMRIRIGTSGYSFKQWKGPFYPEKWPDKRMLEYYCERL